jgi:FtsP/CotA-like multicopper oxidase with cupredoxin domain
VGHRATPDVTWPQLAAVAGVSLLAVTIGMVAPANWVNLRLSARVVGGAMMPPGMIMDRNTPAEAMIDMAAVDPRDVVARYGLDARGDRDLEPRLDGDVRVFDLDTSVIQWTILPGVTVNAYAFNGQIPGPRLRFGQGDRVRINVTNRLPETTTVHWHGLILPNVMDGPAHVTQEPIESGQIYRYEFTAIQSGTYFYHSHDHVDRQQALGLYGAMLIEPREADPALQAEHEYTLLLQEWLMREGLTYPAMPMEGGLPNYFTINGRSYPSTDTIPMRVGERLRVRFIGSNNGFIHPMHIHGGPFQVVAVDGETLPPSARYFADTINVGPGQRYDVIWKAQRPGKWLIHCHIAHHATNNNVETRGGGGLMMIIDVSAS